MRNWLPILFTGLMVACAPTSETAVVAIDPAVGNEAGTAPLPPAEAARLFSSVCGGSLPNFSGAAARMAASGFSIAASTGTRFHPGYDASMRVVDGPGAGQTCSIVFVSNASEQSALQAFSAALGPVADTSFGPAIAYQNGRTIILVTDPVRSGGRTYYNLRMWSER